MEFYRGIEGRLAALPGPDRLGGQGVHLQQIVYRVHRMLFYVGQDMLVQRLLFHFVYKIGFTDRVRLGYDIRPC